MGGIYDSNGRRACDACGNVPATPRRCPHLVHHAPSPSMPNGASLPYCPAPALCAACWKDLGPASRLHARCKESAARAQARADHLFPRRTS